MSRAQSRARQRRSRVDAARDPVGAQRLAAAIGEGVDPAELEAQLLTLPPEETAPAVRALGSAAGPAAVDLLARLAKGAEAVIAVAALDGLGDVRALAAAQVLEVAAQEEGERGLRTAARRALHRLASQGIRPAGQAAVAQPVGPSTRVAALYRALGSAYDGAGTRALWLAAERPLGGVYMILLSINDVRGLIDCSGRDTTRKRFADQEATMRAKDPMAWVELPLEYARQLVLESVETARGAGRAVPAQYALCEPAIGRAAESFREALVYQEISAFEARMHPTLLGETPRLFLQPEIEPWFFEPERVEKWARQLNEPPTARLVITPETEEGRRDRLFREAIADLLPRTAMAGLRRRLEETAYIFLRTDREADARRAVAAAATIEEERPLRPPHPFLRAVLERSIEIALRVERTGFEPPRLTRVP